MPRTFEEKVEAAEALRGLQGPLAVTRVEHGDVRRFAAAIGAERRPFVGTGPRHGGGVIVPPTYLKCVPISIRLTDHGFESGLNAGAGFAWQRPVRPGDVVAGRSRITEVEVTEGRSGRLLLVTQEGEFVNQDGEPVLTTRSTEVFRGGPKDL
jgi:hypothetical protein